MRNIRRAAVSHPFCSLRGSAALATFTLLATHGGAHAQESGRVPIIGGPCEGCEAVFEGLPADLRSAARIAPPDEPGEPLRIEGVVTSADGRTVPGVIVYAYHTDAGGVYPQDPNAPGRASSRHGRLRGWAVTDETGRYAFETVRPGTYPSRSEPAHVHMHVIEPECCTYFLDSIRFDDDPLLDEADRSGVPRGGSGLVHPEPRAEGGWIVRRDIRLGAGVPGYTAPRR